MSNDRFRTRELPLSGRLRTADDPATIGPNDMAICRNMRPWGQHPRGIGGMTKINTSPNTSTGIRNGIHFRKSQPDESHVLAWTSDGKVYRLSNTIPAQGNFDGTVLWTDTAGGGTGRFSAGPGGSLLYGNGKDTCLWGGTEHRCAGFIDFPTTDQVYDYGDVVVNTKTDDSNLATIHAVNAPIDSATMLLLHLDNNVTDSSTATPPAHTVTNVGNNVTYSSPGLFGSHVAYFNGTTAYLTVPDNADFDFSGGSFTIECWVQPTSVASECIYHQNTIATPAADYIELRISAGTLVFEIFDGGVATVYLSGGSIQVGQWSHIAVVESGNSWYLFVNGNIVASTTDTDRAEPGADVYDSTVFIGVSYAGGTLQRYYSGYMEEFRVSNTARWTSSFTPPSAAYGTGYSSTTYIGSIMPLDGFKLYVHTANAVQSTMSVKYWDGGGWVTVSSLSDGTSFGDISLSQEGAVSFTSTASTAKPTSVEKIYIYWYKMVITASSDFSGAEISQVTVSIPYQDIKDIWDGEERPVNACLAFTGGKFVDITTNVLENGYTSTGTTVDTSTFADIGGFTAGDYIYAGFIERMAGLAVYLIGLGNVNSVLSSMEYWNGNAWTSLNATDGTLDGSITFAKTGWMTWKSPDQQNEFRKSNLGVGKRFATSEMRNMSKNPPPNPDIIKTTENLYYYRISFSGAMSSDIGLYHVAGIAAQKDLRGYSFPVHHQNRTVLCCNFDGRENEIMLSSQDSPNVFNGLDSYSYIIGSEEAIVSAAPLFLRFSSSVQDMLVLCKAVETWILEGNGSTDDPYRIRMFSAAIGCTAPLTMVAIPTGEEVSPGIRRSFAVWQSQRGIEMFDGYNLAIISEDIRDKFDPRSSTYAASSSCYGFYDPVYDEYHWVVPGSQEWAFSFKYKKWYEIVRGSAKYLYGGIPVSDTSGDSHIYGFDNAGYLHHLENGTDFDGNSIAHVIKTGSIALNENRISEETSLRMVKVVQVAKNTTANSMTVTHFGDTATSGNTVGSAYSPAASGKRLSSRILNAGSKGPHVFHEFQLALTTDDETCGCEPIYIVAYYDGERQDVR